MELTLSELKPILKYIINNNKILQDSGQHPVGINLVGEAGIGKSEIVENIAKELDYNFVKLNLAQITETGDICGFPIRLHYVCKDNDCQWISPELIKNYADAGYTITSETKMSYALPEWYKDIDISKGTILNLDDATRALPNILQAVYELIYKQEFWSFKMPPNSHIVLTANPDNGDYNVSSIDEAFTSRVVNFNVKFDLDSWCVWAENAQLDSRAINFLLANGNELMDDKGTHKHVMNARSYTMFANIISGINNWEDPKSLALIMQIASGCFDDKDNIVGHLFTQFIAQKLDKLITPADLLLKPWETVKEEIKKCVYDGDRYRPDVASILHTRLLNYSIYYFKQSGAKTDVVQDRILKLIEVGKDPKETLFTEDFFFDIIRTLMKEFPTRTNKFMLNKSIREMVK